MEKQETGRAMFERFSESARRAIFRARFEAGREGAKAMEPEHILRGFLAEDQGDWAEIMASQWRERPLGTAHERPLPAPFLSQECARNLRQALVKSAGAGVAIADEVDMPVGMRSQQVIESALQHAGRSTVGLLHILWALTSDEENSVSSLLKTNGITAEQIDHAIRNLP